MQDSRIITIRRCLSDEERRHCYKLRYAVYLGEQKKGYAADHRHGELHDPLDSGSELLMAMTESGIVVGSVRVTFCDHPAFPEHLAQHLHLDALARGDWGSASFTSRLVIAPGWRNTTLFHDLVCEAYRIGGVPSHVHVSLITCRRALVPLFAHLGYECYGDEFVDRDAGIQQPMLLIPRDLEHLRRTASPFLELAVGRPADPSIRAHVDSVVRAIHPVGRKPAIALEEKHDSLA